MALTLGQVLADVLQDAPEVVALVQEIEAAIQKFPTAVSFKADGELIAAVLPDLGALIDALKAQFTPAAAPAPATVAAGKIAARLAK